MLTSAEITDAAARLRAAEKTRVQMVFFQSSILT